MSLMFARGRPLAAAPSSPANGPWSRVASLAAQPKSRRRRGASSFAGPRGGQALAAATGSGRSRTAVVGSCDARNDVTCRQAGDSTDGGLTALATALATATATATAQVNGRLGCIIIIQRAGRGARAAVPVMQSLLPADIAVALALRRSTGGCAEKNGGEE